VAPIYHITHIRNLEGILQHGGLWCDAERTSRGLTPTNIAHATIKQQRTNTLVPVGRRGCVANYVPFYLAPRSPMLYAIHKGFVDGYSEGQTPILHLVSDTAEVGRNGLPFVFTDGHAATPISRFFTDLNDLNQIDWPLMNSTYWNNTEDDGDRKRRRQAEFLVHGFFPWSLFSTIGVCTADIGQKVRSLLARSPHIPKVHVAPPWYY
jgi:hypothetical protein